MMRLPAQPTAEGLDACFVGIPMDIGTSNRPGTRLGPRALREASALLAYAEQAEADPLALPGSLYGAVGVSQFMPTSALQWGVDGDGDGRCAGACTWS